MDPLTPARRWFDQGRFGDALAALPQQSLPAAIRSTADLLRADLLERTGALRASRLLLEEIRRRRGLTPAQQGECGRLAARLEWHAGNISSAIAILQRAVADARHAQDRAGVCHAQLRLLALVADKSGPDATVTLLLDVRRGVLVLGEPSITATLHLTVAEMEAKRGLLEGALRHTRVAEDILATSPNVWLEAWCESTRQALCLLSGRYEQSRQHGERALDLARLSGATLICRAILGNLGNLHCELGNYDRALHYIDAADACMELTGDHRSAGLETRARIRLAQGRDQEADALLDTIDAHASPANDRRAYVWRHSALTRALLRLRQGRAEEAIERATAVAALAEAAGDTTLLVRTNIVRAQALWQSGRTSEALSDLRSAATRLTGQSLTVQLEYERTLAALHERSGRSDAAGGHHARARRITRAIGAGPAPVGAENGAWPRTVHRGEIIQDLLLAILHAEHPGLAAASLVAAVRASGIAANVSAVVSAAGDQPIDPYRGLPADGAARLRSRITLAVDPPIELLFESADDLETAAAINAVMLAATIVRDMNTAKSQREQELALWPLDAASAGEAAGPIFSGRLAQLQNLARRVARTNVVVLITGESGTGKEIFAREIHAHSSRAARRFVPFNCTAVPRDIAEAHLFGHRRGAFTGAERDSPGLIRAAHGGTLFLDEVGEMDLALQPKLLRFLESGEIQPLGEVGPQSVDVRIIAATNADLEALVHAGRFREDLFYRLNVVRLNLPPLRDRRDEIPALVHLFSRQAATEFAKGHVRVADDTMEHLTLYAWPGNIRQLQNELRRMIALADADATLRPDALSPQLRQPPSSGGLRPGQSAADDKLGPALRRLERDMIKAALQSNGGRIDAAARALGVSRKGLYLKRQRLGV